MQEIKSINWKNTLMINGPDLSLLAFRMLIVAIGLKTMTQLKDQTFIFFGTLVILYIALQAMKIHIDWAYNTPDDKIVIND